VSGRARTVFLSYRREDSAGHAGRLADNLLDRYGAGSVFMDVESIEAGADFTEAISRAIAGADAVLVVIGPGWLDSAGPEGARRIDAEADFVRREIEGALAAETRVIPVLVGGATMPAEEGLPPSIAALARRNAIELQDRRWREDVDALIDVLEGRGKGTLGNLPAQPTPFLGRDLEVAEVVDLLQRPDVRLVTITGPGGIGKTRLAIQAAAQRAHVYEGGTWFVELAALTDPELVLVEVARILEVRGSEDGSLITALAQRLSRVRTLLVLDNLEHLLPDAAATLAELSAAAPSSSLLVTSRQRLDVRAEREISLGVLEDDEAVDLFVGRAEASGANVTELDGGQRQTIAEICARLDRLPLAIELAAARTRMLEPAVMLRKLERRLPLLTGGAWDLPARQRTVRAAIDWSFELLSPADRQLFARLSVFAGGWTLEAAEAICADEGGMLDILEGMESLERISLIQREEHGSARRFRQLATVREYASELRQGTDEFGAVSIRHARYHLAEAEAIHAELLGPHPGAWFERFEPELGNFREAITASLTLGDVLLAVKITAALTASLLPCGYIQEARAVGLDDVLARSAGIRTPEVVTIAIAAGTSHLLLGDLVRSRSLLEHAIELASEIDDPKARASAMSRLCWARAAQNDWSDETFALGEEAVRAVRELGDPMLLAETLNDLSCAYAERGFSSRAVSLGEESLRLRRSSTYAPGIADSLINLGWLMVLNEDFSGAVKYLEEGLEVAADIFQKQHAIIARSSLGLAHLMDAEPEPAERLLLETLRLCREVGDRRTGQEALIGLAGVAALTGAWARAAWLAGAAMTQMTESGAAPGLDPRIRERYLPDARRALGRERYEDAYEQGRLASFDLAVAYALGDVNPNS
jgi:predicted ATPase